MRVLGIDWGKKHIGIATGETEFQVITPLCLIPASGTVKKDALAISVIAQKESISTLILGIPTNGSSEKGLKPFYLLAQALEEYYLKVIPVDESLTSIEGNERLKNIGMKASHRRKIRDTQAACIIIERFFNETQT